mmetsp:Transcript_2469/g.5862  ORF Transcript_2469/g.5862 Transcript_2469/m.5862 type:complete len:399 (-) Transcript_2469:112-1308(-)
MAQEQVEGPVGRPIGSAADGRDPRERLPGRRSDPPESAAAAPAHLHPLRRIRGADGGASPVPRQMDDHLVLRPRGPKHGPELKPALGIGLLEKRPAGLGGSERERRREVAEPPEQPRGQRPQPEGRVADPNVDEEGAPRGAADLCRPRQLRRAAVQEAPVERGVLHERAALPVDAAHRMADEDGAELGAVKRAHVRILQRGAAVADGGWGPRRRKVGHGRDLRVQADARGVHEILVLVPVEADRAPPLPSDLNPPFCARAAPVQAFNCPRVEGKDVGREALKRAAGAGASGEPEAVFAPKEALAVRLQSREQVLSQEADGVVRRPREHSAHHGAKTEIQATVGRARNPAHLVQVQFKLGLTVALLCSRAVVSFLGQHSANGWIVFAGFLKDSQNSCNL